MVRKTIKQQLRFELRVFHHVLINIQQHTLPSATKIDHETCFLKDKTEQMLFTQLHFNIFLFY